MIAWESFFRDEDPKKFSPDPAQLKLKTGSDQRVLFLFCMQPIFGLYFQNLEFFFAMTFFDEKIKKKSP